MRLSLDSILKDPYKFYKEKVIPTLIQQFNIPEEYHSEIYEINLKIDETATTSYYDPSTNTIVINPKMINSLEKAMIVFGEETTHAIVDRIFREKDNMFQEFLGYIGRYALADGLNITLELKEYELKKVEIDDQNSLKLFDGNSFNLLFEKSQELKVGAYDLLINYLDGKIRKQDVENFFNKLSKVYNSIYTKLNYLEQVRNFIDNKIKDIKPGTLEAIYLEQTGEALSSEINILRSTLDTIKTIISCPSDEQLYEIVNSTFGDFIRAVPEDKKQYAIEVFYDVIKKDYIMCIYKDIGKLDNNSLKDILYELKKRVTETSKKLRRELSNTRDIEISVNDMMRFIEEVHNIGYLIGSRILYNIKNGKLTYAKAFWNYKEIFSRYVNNIWQY